MLITLSIIALALYITASTLQLLHMLGKIKPWPKVILALSFCAVVAHGFLLHRWIDVSAGQNLTFFNVLSQVLWVAVVLVWLMALFRPLVNLGVLVYPLAALSILCVMLFSGEYIVDAAAHPLKLFHILISFLALGIFIIVAVQAAFFWVRDCSLRKKYTSPLIKSLPSLQGIESLLFQWTTLGFCFLGLAIITGFSFYPDFFNLQKWAHLWLPLLAWIVFGLVLMGRLCLGWRGKVAIRWIFLGILLLLIGYFFSQFWSF